MGFLFGGNKDKNTPKNSTITVRRCRCRRRKQTKIEKCTPKPVKCPVVCTGKPGNSGHSGHPGNPWKPGHPGHPWNPSHPGDPWNPGHPGHPGGATTAPSGTTAKTQKS